MRPHQLSPTNHPFKPAHVARVLRSRLFHLNLRPSAFQNTDELKGLDDKVVFAGQCANGVRCHPFHRLRSKMRRLNVFCSQPFLCNVSYADSWLKARGSLDHTSRFCIACFGLTTTTSCGVVRVEHHSQSSHLCFGPFCLDHTLCWSWSPYWHRAA